MPHRPALGEHRPARPAPSAVGTRPAGLGVAVVLAGLLAAAALVPIAATPATGAPATVTVSPGTDLVDGQGVVIEGAGFPPNAIGGISQCSEEQLPILACLAVRVLVKTDATGAFRTRVDNSIVRRLVSIPGSDIVDCAVRQCVIRTDFAPTFVDTPITFDPDVPAVNPTLTASTTTDLYPGQRVLVSGRGWRPSSTVFLAIVCALQPCGAFGGFTTVATDAGGAFRIRLPLLSSVNDATGQSYYCSRAPAACRLAAYDAAFPPNGDVAALRLTFGDPDVVSITGAAIVEPTGTNAALLFRLDRPATFTDDLTVSYQVGDGTATAPDDFVTKTGTVTFTSLQQTRFVSVAVKPDAIREPRETFTVTLSDPSTGRIGRGTATGTIIDQGPPVTVCAATSGVVEGDGSIRALRARLDLTTPSATPVTVRVRTADGTAVAGTDYVAVDEVVTIPAFTERVVVPVAVLADDAAEPVETFSLGISEPVGAAIDPACASATQLVLDDD